MSRILVFRLIGLFAPQAKSGESLITEERDDRYSAAIHRPLEFLINKVIGKLDITSILTGVTIEDAANTSPINGTQTHRTGLTRSVDSTSRKVKCAKTTTSLTDGIHLCMSRRVVIDSDTVAASCYNLSILHDDGSEWTTTTINTLIGQSDSLTHKLLILFSNHNCMNW